MLRAVNITFDVRAVHIHYHGATADNLRLIQDRLDTLMATQAELATSLAEVTAKVTKIGTETQTLLVKIQELTDAIAAGTTTAEVDAALAALQAQVAIVDDLVADAPAP